MIELKDVSKFYSQNDVVTMGMRRVSVCMKRGEFIAVTGESGSGKSTFLNVVSGVDSYEEGELIIDGRDTTSWEMSDWEKFRRENVSFIFQNNNLIDSYTVLMNVEIALLPIMRNGKERRARALELIREVGLEEHLKHRATQLSGGQKQRLAIARALASKSPIIYADEPTGNLDSVAGKEIMKLLYDIAADKLVVVVTHDYDDVSEYATRKIRFFDGGIVEDKIIRESVTFDNIIDTEAVENVDNSPNIGINDDKLVADTADMDVDTKANLSREKRKKSKENIEKSMKNGGYNTYMCTKIAVQNVRTTPKKSIFTIALFVLLIALSLAVFMSISSMFGGGGYMRGVGNINSLKVTRADGGAITDEDIATLMNKGAYYVDDKYMDLPQIHSSIAPNVKSIKMLDRKTCAHAYGATEVARGEAYYVYHDYSNSDAIIESYVGNEDRINFTPRESMGDDEKGDKVLPIRIVGQARDALGKAQSTIYINDEDYKEYFGYYFMGKTTSLGLTLTPPADWEYNVQRFNLSVHLDKELAPNTIKLALHEKIEDISSKIIYSYLSIDTEELETEDILPNVKYECSKVTEGGRAAYLSQDVFDKVMNARVRRAVNAFVDSTSVQSTKNIATSFEKLGFVTYYPYGYSVDDADEDKQIMTTIANIITFFVMVILLSIVYIVASRLVATRESDYVAMRALGYTKHNIMSILCFEFLIEALIGIFINLAVFIPLQLCVISLRHMLSVGTYALVICVSLLGSLIIAYRSTKRMFSSRIRKARRAK